MRNLHISVLLARIGSLRVYKLMELTVFRGILDGVFKRIGLLRGFNYVRPPRVLVQGDALATGRVDSDALENTELVILSSTRFLRLRRSMNLPRQIMYSIQSFLGIGIITILRTIPDRFIILNAHDSAFMFPQEFRMVSQS